MAHRPLLAERQPVATVRAAPAAVALFVDEAGHVFRRRFRARTPRHADELARLGAAGSPWNLDRPG